MARHNQSAMMTLRLTDFLANHSAESLRQAYLRCLGDGWTFLAVDQSCGRCYYRTKEVTIPIWAMRKGDIYLSWYCAHEIAHTIAGWQAKHGPEFMAALKQVCPSYAIHLEATYKPREVIRAGISIEDILKDD